MVNLDRGFRGGQRRLKNSTVLISRCGGRGNVVAYELAAAGVGRLIIAHGGNVKYSDLNRQLLMTHDWLGKPRIKTIERRLKDLNPRLESSPSQRTSMMSWPTSTSGKRMFASVPPPCFKNDLR